MSDAFRLPRALEGKAAPDNKRLTLIACPTCRESVFYLSASPDLELHIECATCPPAPAVRFTVDHLRMAGTPAGGSR